MNFPITLEFPDGHSTVVIDIAQPDMADEITDFFEVNLAAVSPNDHILNYDAPPLGSEEEKQNRQARLQVIRSVLGSPYSLTAREQTTGRLVALIWNKMITPSMEQPGGTPTRLLYAIMQALTEDHDLFSLYKTDKVFEIRIVAVSSDFGRKGLATKLMELSIQIAIQNGAGVVETEAVSEYTSRAATKLGFITLKSIDYATYEYDGIKPFAGNEDMLKEHPTARFMVLPLPSTEN